MANRYTEIDFNQPVSSYVPMPMDFIYKAGLQKQKDYESAAEESDKLNDLMATVNAIDAHSPYKKALADKYYPQIENIADRIVNKGDMSARRDLNKIARQWQHDPVREELEQSYANYKLYQQDKIKKGEKYAEWHDPTLGFSGEGQDGPNAFRYTGMGERTDHQKRAHDMMAGIAEDAAKSAGFKINPDGTITKGGSGSEHIFSTKVQELAAIKTQDFLTTSEGQDFAKQLKYYNPNLKDEDLMNEATKYLYDAGANQIFEKTESQSDVGFIPKWMHDQGKEEAGSNYSNLPIIEGNVSTNAETNKSVFKALGMNTDYINDDGSVKTDDIKNISKEDVNYVTNRAKKFLEDYKKSGGTDVQGMLVYGKSYLHMLNQINNNDLKQRYVNKNKDLITKGFQYGILNNHKNDDGSIDYLGLENEILSIGKNISKQASNIQGLQQDFATNMSNMYLGKHSGSDKDGIFNQSPLFQKLNIYEQNNPNSAEELRKDNTASKLAENGKFIGLDFNDPNLGAVSMTATKGKNDVEPKLYNAVVPDVNLKSSMKPVHDFSQKFKKSMTSGLSQNEKYVNSVSALQERDNYIKSLKSNGAPKEIIDNFESLYNNITNSKLGVITGYSTIDKKTNQPKYTLIGSIDFVDGKPVEKVLRIDRTTGQYEMLNLGDIQTEENAYIQKLHAPGYNKKSPGYVPKDVEYTDEE